MDYETFATILRSEGMTDEFSILALWSTREDRELSEDRVRLAAQHIKVTLPEYFKPLA